MFNQLEQLVNWVSQFKMNKRTIRMDYDDIDETEIIIDTMAS